MYSLNDGMEGKSKPKGAEGISLLDSTLAENRVIAKVEDGMGTIAALHPG